MFHGNMISRPNSKGTEEFLVNHFNSDDKMEEARYVDNINQGGVKDISKGKMNLGDNFLDGSMIGADLQGPGTESNQVKEVGLKNYIKDHKRTKVYLDTFGVKCHLGRKSGQSRLSNK